MHVRWLMTALLVGGTAARAAAQRAAPTPHDSQGTHAASAVAPLRRPVTLALRNVPLVEAIQAIDLQADLRLEYTDRLPHLNRHVSIAVTNVPAGEALARVLDGTGIAVRVTAAGHIALVQAVRGATLELRPDSGIGGVWGRVTDSLSARPLSGAVVTVDETTLTTTTNDSGYYSLPQTPSGVETIVARMIGYRQTSRTTGVSAGSMTRVDLRLAMEMSRLQEVVTTATGPKRRLEMGNDITILNVDSITATEPIRSVTDLLAARVPGLTVLRTSGAPGDPARLRLRGEHSALLNNDPIVIIDGVRVYAQQSAARSSNLATEGSSGYAPPAPSPLDQIDPNSIETIEVLKGPSAATLYGSDAANGVIVITTKHGRPGPARWSAHVDYGGTYLPGSYPEGYFRWGHPLATNDAMFCPLRNATCMLDSLVRFQLLNDPRYSVLGHGNRVAGTVGVSGGNGALTYQVTGSVSNELGLLTLPPYEVARYESAHGAAPPSWLSRPQDYRTWSAATGLNMRLSPKANVTIQASLSRGNQQRSTLESELATLMRIYVDTSFFGGDYLEANGAAFTPLTSLFGDFYRRVTDLATNFTNGVSLNWEPRSWLTTSADAGINYIDRDDRMVLPRDLAPLGPDTVGSVSLGHGTSLMQTLDVRATATTPLPLGLRLQTAFGANYTSTNIADFQLSGTNLPVGTTSLDGAGYISAPNEQRSDLATFGWYIEPSISGKRFWLSTGLRLDGGSTFGAHARLPSFPKVSLSYLISDEPWFPLKTFFNTLRLRLAYGEAGVQPGVSDRLRLYEQRQVWYDSSVVTATTVQTMGNSALRPERSRELEGGFDADFLDDRVTVGVTGYRQTRIDALIDVPLPPSVYGEQVTSVLKNIGVIRNTGLELTLGMEPVRTDLVTWGANVILSRNHNKVLSLAPGMTSFFTSTGEGVVAGYPLFGRWARPIIGYQDLNHDGIIESNEVLVGDSLAYMGASDPNYQLSLSTHLSLFRGRVSAYADFHYESGMTQLNQTAMQNQIFSAALNDPHAPFGQQAAVAAMNRTTYGEFQTVSTFRFNSLSVSYAVPRPIAQRLGAAALSVAVQGTNLGLFTNYRGKDPNVNAYGSGNGVADTGVLPQPRTWQMRVSATY